MTNKKEAYENKMSELAMKKHLNNSNRGHEPIIKNVQLPIHDKQTLKDFMKSLIGKKIA